jgi:hypothetical protein
MGRSKFEKTCGLCRVENPGKSSYKSRENRDRRKS